MPNGAAAPLIELPDGLHDGGGGRGGRPRQRAWWLPPAQLDLAHATLALLCVALAAGLLLLTTSGRHPTGRSPLAVMVPSWGRSDSGRAARAGIPSSLMGWKYPSLEDVPRDGLERWAAGTWVGHGKVVVVGGARAQV